eukprot:1102276-Rhodomonas_salina.1
MSEAPTAPPTSAPRPGGASESAPRPGGVSEFQQVEILKLKPDQATVAALHDQQKLVADLAFKHGAQMPKFPLFPLKLPCS